MVSLRINWGRVAWRLPDSKLEAVPWQNELTGSPSRRAILERNVMVEGSEDS